MYTFLICALISFLVSGVIFGKRLRDNKLFVGLIVVAGTLIGVSAINGILGLSIPFTEVKVKEYPLEIQVSEIITPSDTLKLEAYVEFDYRMKADSSIKHSNLDFVHFDYMEPEESGRLERFSIYWLPEGDTIPRYEIWKEKRIVKDSKWISSIGIPNGRRLNRVYIPCDSVHMVLVNELNDKFFPKDEKRAIALAN
jgi:hypothetical protein